MPNAVQSVADFKGEHLEARMLGVVGDGTTDDSEALAAAFASVAGNGRRVLSFAPGVYVVNSPVVVPGNINLVNLAAIFPRYGGYDAGNATLQMGAIIKAGPSFPSTPYTPVLDARGVNNVRIHGLEIAGNVVTLTDAAISSGSADLSSASASFQSADVGKSIYVVGAAADGKTLSATIASFVNTNTVTLSDLAGATVSNAYCRYGSSVGIALGSYGDDPMEGFATNGYIDHCAVSNHLTGIGIDQFNYLKVRDNYIADNMLFGVYAHVSGDSDYSGNMIHNTGRYVYDDDRTMHIGMFLGLSTGNSRVRGGKFEYNKIGLTSRSIGHQIIGVGFDANAGAHIQVSSPGDAAVSAEVIGCRFLGGGHTWIQFPGAAIWIEAVAQVSPPAWGGLLASPVSLVVKGCDFKASSDDIPFEYYQGARTEDVGPSALIYGGGGGVIRCTFAGNHIDSGYTGSAFNFFQHHSRSYIICSDNAGVISTTGASLPPVFARAADSKIAYSANLDAPTEGTWYIGDRILNIQYEASGVRNALVCVKDGSLHADVDLTGITASIAATEYVATFDQSIKHLIAPGDVIAIAGDGVVYHRVQFVDYDASTATLYSAAANTVTGAAVTFAVPVFTAESQIGYRSVSGSPFATTPNHVGELLFRSDSKTWYAAGGTNAADWRGLNGDQLHADYVGSVSLGRQHCYVTVDTDSASRTITLPSAADYTGKVYIIRRTTGGVNSCTVSSSGGNIKPQGVMGTGSTSLSMPNQGDTLAVVSDGADWNAFTHPSGIKIFANGDVALPANAYVIGLTNNMPVFTDGDKKLVSQKVDIGNAGHVQGTGLTADSLLAWDGSGKVKNAASLAASRIMVTDGAGAPSVASSLASGKVMYTNGAGLPSTVEFASLAAALVGDLDDYFVTPTVMALYTYSEGEIDTYLAGKAEQAAYASHTHGVSGNTGTTDSHTHTVSLTSGSP